MSLLLLLLVQLLHKALRLEALSSSAAG